MRLQHYKYLDGFRGIAALWVMIGHILIIYDINLRVLSWVSLPVDLFMLVSGFLMVRHAIARETAEPLDRPLSWATFWLRRFFRIAPLYYFLLLFSIIYQQSERGFDGAFHYHTWDGLNESYDQFVAHLLSHVSFVFGLSPVFSRSTSMPDWSLSLEMQFYALFPFLMLLGRRTGWITLAIGVAGVCLAAELIFPSFLHEFTLPSILILKLNIFMGGMLVALALDNRGQSASYIAVAVALMILPLWGGENFKAGIARALLCAGFATAALCDRYSRTAGMPAHITLIPAILGARPFAIMADLSYGVYLMHFFVIFAWARLTAPEALLAPLSGAAGALIAVPAASYALAWVARQTVELRGIEFGRQVIQRFRMLSAPAPPK
ncbi:MAG TPA: acyltransferase [Methylocella sp.]|nr:acyltransferase [Methylocella sp.]